MMGWYGGAMGPIGWLAMGVTWFLLLGLVVWLVVQVLPGTSGVSSPDAGESPLEILDRRLASGEIDLEIWQTQRAALVTAARDRW